MSNGQRAAALVDSGAVDLVLVEWGCGVELDVLLATARGRAPVVGLIGGDRRQAFLDLLCRREVFNICAPRADDKGRGAFDAGELVATCEKILRRDCFGLDKYMSGFGIELSHQVIVRALERDQVVERLTAVVRALGGGRRLVESVGLVADELITNAIYNAPRDPDGQPRYAHRSRREKVTLEPTEYVRLDYGSDGRAFGIAVTDNFGRLTPDTIRAGIERCLTCQDPIEQKQGGAGLGIYTALGSVNQLVVNVDQGVRTEVIALWDLERRGRGAGPSPGSLHVFASTEAAARARRRASTGDLEGEAVPQATVALSESIRRDICQTIVDRPEDRVSLSSVGRVRMTAPDRFAHTLIGVPPAPEVEHIEVDHGDGAVPVPLPAPVRVPMDAGPTGDQAADIRTIRGVQILRRADRPGLVATLDRIRETSQLSVGIESALTYLLNRWDAAVLLCRVGGSLVPWTGAGDIDSWEAICETAVPLGLDMIETGSFPTAPERETLHQDSGWLGACAAQPGIGFGLSAADSVASRLSALITGAEERGDALALSVGVGMDVVLLIFACRTETGGPDDDAAYEQLHAELTQLLLRVDEESNATPMVPMSWAVGG
ncbi:MAG TPA: hypothetical protein VFU21_07330 [Kofleriaceae bacterium]|nr:hypothetical protein [Kofleriaceae bacterium]